MTARVPTLARRALAIALLALPLLGVTPASAQVSLSPQYIRPTSLTWVPPGYGFNARRAIAIADGQRDVRDARARAPRLYPIAFVGGRSEWTVVYYAPGRGGKLHAPVEVDVDSRSGRVRAVWTGPQVFDYLARGHFGQKADALWIWLPLCLLFLIPFIDRRRPFRLLHLDLLAMLAFGVSHLFFNRGHVFLSVPLVYPVLAYLLGRMLITGFRQRERREPLVPHLRSAWLVVGLVLLVAFRIGVNLYSQHTIDVGMAGVVGAQRIAHHQPLYVDNDAHGDTYGPFNYIAYLPFVKLFHWSGGWSSVPPAQAASITFDLLTLIGLFLLGSGFRAGPEGRRLGIALAYAWAAFPYTLYALALNTNDALVAMLLVYSLVALRSAPVRGALIGLAAAAKFMPLAVAPLVARGRGNETRRAQLGSLIAAAGVVIGSIVLYLPRGGFPVFWKTTLGFQLSRPTDFSIWVQHPALHWLQLVVAAAAVGLALVVAVVPGRRDVRQIAALSAAVVIALQLPARHWFYFYVVWFSPLVLFSLFALYETRARGDTPDEIEMGALVPDGLPAGVA